MEKTDNQVHIDTSLIPEHIRFELLAIAYEETKKYFKQPGVKEAFERWQAAREAESKE